MWSAPSITITLRLRTDSGDPGHPNQHTNVWWTCRFSEGGGSMRAMASVQFELSRRFDAPARELWDELVDWPAHGAWIPATTIEGEPGDPTEVGYTFTAWTGIRPVALEDRMRVTRCDWDDAAQTGICDVEKLGPVLSGTAGFTVRRESGGSVLEWREDVTVPYLPGFLSPVAAFAGRLGFKTALRSLAKVLARR
jgi:hypothetical protein